MRLSLRLLLSISLLAGCAAPQPPGPAPTGLQVPQDWADATAPRADTAAPRVGASALAAWWERFHDPLLASLVEEALQANTSVESGRQAWAQARALAEVAAAGLRPSVQAVASAQRNRTAGSTGSSAGAGARTFNTLGAGFDASWETDLFQRLHAAAAAAVLDAQASQADLGALQVALAAEVAVDYMQLRSLQARWAIAQANGQSQQNTLQITRWRQQAGLLTALELAQAQTAALQTQALLPPLASAATQMEHSLAVLTHRAPAALHLRLSPPGATLAAPEALVLAFPAETLRQRADVRAAELRVGAAYQRTVQADAARYPDLQLSGNLGLSALGLAALGRSSAGVFGLLASVSVPVLDGGAARAQLRAQQAALQQAAVQYDAVVLAALAEVEGGLVSLRGNRERLRGLQEAEQAASHAARLARQRFASGLVDFQVVLETQRSALLTQDAQASALVDLQTDHVRLYKALGGGWEPAMLDLSPPTTRTGARG